MVVFNYSGAEINAKVVYYGPALSGKTTNLEHIYKKMPANSKGKMVSMKTRTDRTLFFDFLPLELGEINGYRTRILLYTVPGQVYYNATRKLVLKGADAVVFVADSSRSKMNENVESLRNLEENLNEHGLTLDTIPWVMQYNKRDLPDALPVQALAEQLNLLGVPSFEAVASTGRGIYETFQAIAGSLYGQLVERLKNTQPGPRAAAPAPATPPPVPVRAEPSGASADAEGAVSDLLDNALREIDAGPKAGQKAAKGAGRSGQRSRANHTAAAASAPRATKDAGDASLDRDLQFAVPRETSTAAPDVGRVVDFEDIPRQETGREPESEFIVDPFHSNRPSARKAPPPVTPPLAPSVSTPLPAAPAVTAPPAPEPVDAAVTLTVPVLISRSQIGKVIPIRIELEIQVDDEEA